MGSTRLRRCAAIATLLLAGACGGDDDATVGPGEDPPGSADERPVEPTDGAESEPPTTDPGGAPAPGTTEVAGPSVDGDPSAAACALLDVAFLDRAFAGQTGTFGDPYRFQTGIPSPDGLTCTWDDGSTGLSLRITLEDAATAEVDDHSGRAYNLDVDPVVEPQDGPGEHAALLVDTAFEDLGGDGLPYGYFFVASGFAVFVETVGLDIGAEGLGALADEAAIRLAAG